MRKKADFIFMALVLVILPAFFTVGSADAFCVYNETDKVLFVQETGGGKIPSFGGFIARNLQPGENKCCNWQDKDCNSKGKRDSIVTFQVSTVPITSHDPPSIDVCTGFPIKAGGWLTVVGKNNRYTCTAHF